jgi:hypothetical protein
VENSPEVVDLLLSLFYTYAVSSNVMAVADLNNGLLPSWQAIKGWVSCSGRLENSASAVLKGAGTKFKKQLQPGDAIKVVAISMHGNLKLGEQIRKVVTVESDNTLTLAEPFSCNLDGVAFNRMREGGSIDSNEFGDSTKCGVGRTCVNILDGWHHGCTGVPSDQTGALHVASLELILVLFAHSLLLTRLWTHIRWYAQRRDDAAVGTIRPEFEA